MESEEPNGRQLEAPAHLTLSVAGLVFEANKNETGGSWKRIEIKQSCHCLIAFLLKKGRFGGSKPPPLWFFS